jgi:two-component system OmpR family response regulator
MKQKRILIVDDEVSITQLLRLNLEKTGRYIVRAENAGAGVFAAAREFKPDLILLDVMLPDLEGGLVAAQLQSDPHLKAVPIVFLTAAVKKQEVEARQGLIGGLPFIAKPVNVKDVIGSIEKNLAVPPLN